MNARSIVAGVVASIALLGATAASAQDYPAKPVRLVVPFAAGGASDSLARMLAQAMTPGLGQTVVVENRPGAGGIIAGEYVARAPADGYTLLFGTIGTHGIAPVLQRNIPYDATKDFAAVGMLHELPLVLMANQTVEAKTLPELLAFARANPGKLTYASSGIGSVQHMAGELFRSLGNVDIVHVPFKGGGAGLPDFLAGHVAIMFEPTPNALPSIRGGRARAIALSSASRSPMAPEIPTFAEQGLAGMEVNAWTGLFAPAATPAPVVARLGAELKRVSTDAAYVEKLRAAGTTAAATTPAEFATFVRNEVARWRATAAKAGIKQE